MFKHHYIYTCFKSKESSDLIRDLHEALPQRTLTYIKQKLDAGCSLIDCIFSPRLHFIYKHHSSRGRLILTYNHIASWLINYNYTIEVNSIYSESLPLLNQHLRAYCAGYHADYLNIRLNCEVL